MRFAIGLAVALVLAMAATAQARSPEALLARFQPVTVFHPAEEFRPVPVEAFIRDANLEAATGPATWVVADPLRLRTRCRRRSPPAAQPARLLRGRPGRRPGLLRGRGRGRAGPRGLRARRPRRGRTVLQYWLFYYDNVYRYPFLPRARSGSRTRATGRSWTWSSPRPVSRSSWA